MKYNVFSINLRFKTTIHAKLNLSLQHCLPPSTPLRWSQPRYTYVFCDYFFKFYEYVINVY